jgi:hypothetical protein
VPPTRSQRSGPTLDAVRDAVRAEFGGAARIVAAERVTTPGIGGLFRKAHVEVTIEVPAPEDVPTARVAIADGAVKRAGIAALLADADEAEARIAGVDRTAATRADAFASVLDGFAADGISGSAPRRAGAGTDARSGDGAAPRLPADDPDPLAALQAVLPPGAVPSGLPGGAVPAVDGVTPTVRRGPAAGRPPVPAVLSADGDLVVLVGRAGDVDAAAGVFATTWALRQTDAADRRAAILARADGVRGGHALLGVASWDDRRTLEAIGPDQVWVVVDAGRKPADTLAMLTAVAAVVPVAGVLAIGADETASPETVHELGVAVRTL